MSTMSSTMDHPNDMNTPYFTEYIATNIFFPLKLPPGESPNFTTLEMKLFEYFKDSFQLFASQSMVQLDHGGLTDKISKMLDTARQLLDLGAVVDQHKLEKLVNGMTVGDVIPVYIEQQNTVLTFRKPNPGVTILEAFGVATHSARIFETSGSLQQAFPTKALLIHSTSTENPCFVQKLAACIHGASTEFIELAAEKVKKGGNEVLEMRQKPNSQCFTGMLWDMLCQDTEATTPVTITKRVRDDSIHEYEKLPFRRSPMYLYLRAIVHLETHLAKDTELYKSFMLFIVSDTLQRCVEQELSHDLIFCGMRRVVRKWEKLGLKSYTQKMVNALSCAKARLGFYWPPKMMSNLDLAEVNDTREKSHRFSNLLQRMENTEFRVSSNGWDQSKEDNASRAFRLALDSDLTPAPENFDGIQIQDTFQVLINVESWVKDELPLLKLSSNQNLSKLGCRYLQCASNFYRGNAEEIGIMVLTVFEIWKVIDELAIRADPRLKKWNTGIPERYLSPVRLKTFSELERLGDVENYLMKRFLDADPNNTPHLGEILPGSYAVQYANHSPELQEVHQQISNQVENGCNSKMRELKEKVKTAPENKERLNAWRRNGYLHETQTGSQQCVRGCEGCALKELYEIWPYESPLPTDLNQVKAALFELKLPSSFSAWREITWKILEMGIGEDNLIEGEQVYETLAPVQCSEPGQQPRWSKVYRPLRRYSTPVGQTITLGSKNKAFKDSHFRSYFVPVRKDLLIRQSALHFELTTGSHWITEQISNPSLLSLCSAPPLSEPYESLNDAVNFCERSSKEIIANKSAPLPGLTESERASLLGIRGKEELQLLNIKHVLIASTKSLNNEAFFTCIQHALWQAGTANGDVHRVSHRLLRQEPFCAEFLKVIDSTQLRIRDDPAQERTLSLLITLTLRIHSLSPSEEIKSKALEVLQSLRSLVYTWIQQVKISDCINSPKGSPVLRMALLARLTYDTEPSALSDILRSDTALEILLRCTDLVHQNSPVFSMELPMELRGSILRDTRLGRKLSDPLAIAASQRSSVTSRVVGDLLEAFAFQNTWTRQSGDYEAWIETTATRAGNTVKVEFNTFTGSTLVAGQLIGPLPEKYRSSESYRVLFHDENLKVVISPYTQYEYRTVASVKGKMYYFSIRNDESIIYEGHANGSIDGVLEFIPSRYFEDDMPSLLIDESTAWLNREVSEIHLFPRQSLDPSAAETWTISFDTVSKSFAVLHKNGDSLQPIGNFIPQNHQELQLRHHLNSLFRIEYWDHINVYNRNGQYSFKLPRFDISFVVNKFRKLECNELKAVVDEDQSIGTLFGLKTYLVLQDTDPGLGRPKRILIVPKKMNGDVAIIKTATHVSLDTRPDREQKQVNWSAYKIDNHLRCLQTLRPGDIHGRYFMILLHGLTSGFLPDPFTMKTGVEEALYGLREKSLYSSTPLSPNLRPLLMKISRLTPIRTFYPVHRRVMQRVEWNTLLSQNSQHDDFYVLIADLVRHSNGLKSVLPGNQKLMAPDDRQDLKGFSPMLLVRGRVKGSCVRHQGSCVTIQDNLYRECTDEVECEVEDGWRQKGENWGDNCRAIMKMISQGKVDDSLGCGSELQTILFPQMKSNILPPQVRSTLILPKFDSLSEQIDLSICEHWLALYELLRQREMCHVDKRNFLKFLIGPLCYGSSPISNIVTLVRVALTDEFSEKPPPRHPQLDREHVDKETSEDHSYHPDKGLQPCGKELHAALRQYFYDPFRKRGKQFSDEKMTKDAEDSRSECTTFVNRLLDQYPNRQIPSFPGLPIDWDFLEDHEGATKTFKSYFEKIAANRKLNEHALQFDSVLRNLSIGRASHLNTTHPTRIPVYEVLRERKQFVPRLTASFFQGEVEPFETRPHVYVETGKFEHGSSLPALKTKMTNILGSINPGKSTSRKEFYSTLSKSHKALEKMARPIKENIPEGALKAIEANYAEWKTRHDKLFSMICSAVGKENGLPSLNPRDILKMLPTSSAIALSHSWKNVILEYAISITMLQRLERLAHSIRGGNTGYFFDEATNQGHTGWEDAPESVTPDWILLEIEKNILIRPAQIRVALTMVSPKSKSNAIFQIMMGFGKTSIIFPMIATLLASDKEVLSEFVAPKQLLRALQSGLTSSLGGLLGITVFRIPCSRDTPKQALDYMSSIWKQCLQSHAILLAEAQDSMNLKLTGLEALFAGDYDLGLRILKMHRDWDFKKRRILDECDAILRVDTQLVYPLGDRKPMDGGSDRYMVPANLLSSLRKIILENGESIGLELKSKEKGEFPNIERHQREQLLSLLVEDIGKGCIGSVDFTNVTEKQKSAALTFIRDQGCSKEVFQLVSEAFTNDTKTMKSLYVLRAQLAYGTFFNAITRQWMVDFGLDLKRSNEALPFHAKGRPKESSEFGHPDLKIVLTLRAYSHMGLTSDQLLLTIQHLIDSSDSEEELDLWNKYSETPVALTSLENISQQDGSDNSAKLLSDLKHNPAVIKNFLAFKVFREACKEQPKRLSQTSWDIANPEFLNTTGCTGTINDPSFLPSSIKQENLQDFEHVLAMQVAILLREDNSSYVTHSIDGSSPGAEDLLQMLFTEQYPPVQVFIDAGPQMFEKDNREVASILLKLRPEAEGVVFFEADEAMILLRTGAIQLLADSKYNGQLENCLVYMDHISTRGVDLKLPHNFRAAVTLGIHLAFEDLLQGCMRLRELERTQSVLFVGTPEIEREIRQVTGEKGNLSSVEVLKWCIEKTLATSENKKKLFESQKFLHEKHQAAEKIFWTEIESLNGADKSLVVQRFEQSMVESSSSSLAEMYGIGSPATNLDLLVEIQQQVQQEKEVQVEQELQVQPAPRLEPLDATNHEDLVEILEFDIPLMPIQDLFQNAWTSFRDTFDRCDVTFDPDKSSLYATEDFLNVVKLGQNDSQQDYLHTPRFVLSSKVGYEGLSKQILVLISPAECGKYLNDLQNSELFTLHDWTPRTLRRPVSLDDPLLTTAFGPSKTEIRIAPQLRAELILFSGQLYMSDEKQCHDVRKFLEDAFCITQKKASRGKRLRQPLKKRDSRWDVVWAIAENRNEDKPIHRTDIGRMCRGEAFREDEPPIGLESGRIGKVEAQRSGTGSMVVKVSDVEEVSSEGASDLISEEKLKGAEKTSLEPPRKKQRTVY